MPKAWLVFAVWLVACGGSTQPAAMRPAPKPQATAQAPLPPPRPINTLYRDEIASGRRAGLGYFFELVELEPMGDVDSEGRMTNFQGFRIVALRPASVWLSFDFAPGDLVTHINSVSAGHYSTWLEQFEALSTADQIRVDLIRDGNPKTVVVKIEDRGKGTVQAKPPLPAVSAVPGNPARH